MTQPIVLDERLRAVADLVRQGAYFADIGTDHAYLPVFLLESGKILGAYASDVAEGPLRHARDMIKKHDMHDRVIIRSADGLTGLFSAFPDVTDIAVCGMGGELIAKILDKEPLSKNAALHFVLQPMSRPEDLRLYLAGQGFSIQKEVLAQAAGRIYSCFSVVYTGEPYTLSPLEALVGKAHLASPHTPLFYEYLSRIVKREEEKRNGMARGACDTRKKDALIAEMRAILQEGDNI